MEIKTKALGTVQIEEDQIITLSEGFYGFKKYHRFALLDAKQKPFIWIQSLDDAQLAFIAIDPFIFQICKGRSLSIKRIKRQCSWSSAGKNGRLSMISSLK